MKIRVTAALLLAALVGLGGCRNKSAQKPAAPASDTVSVAHNSTVFGVCGLASAMNTLQVIAAGGDTLNLSVYDANERRQVFGGYALGDRMAVLVNDKKTEATLVVNITTMAGRWVYDAGADSVGTVSFLEDGNVDGFSFNNEQFDKWNIVDGKLVLSSKHASAARRSVAGPFEFVRLDSDSLVLAGRNVFLKFKRKADAAG